MWSREENRNRCNDGEEREEDQANAVNDHGSKFPVVAHARILLVCPNLFSDDTQLLEDTGQFAVGAETVVERYGLVLT